VHETFAKMFENDIRDDKARGEVPQDWYFTFGYDHTSPEGESLKNRYMVFHGTSSEARMQMFEAFNNQWSHQYSTRTEAGIDRFGLTEYKYDGSKG
jgi:hypothetical protein